MISAVDESRFSRLVTLAQSAGLDQRKWSWFLREFQEVSGCARAQLFSHDMRTCQPLGFHQYGYEPAFLDSYKSHFGKLNPWAAVFDSLKTGQTVLGSDLVPDEDLLDSEFYCDWLRPQEDIIGSAGTVLECQSNRITAFAANVRRKDRERVEPFTRDLMQKLVPHLQHSLKVSAMLGRLALENRILWAGMDPAIAALFVLDGKGRVRFANARGDALAEHGTVLRTDMLSRLSFTDTEANIELSRALHDQTLPSHSIQLPFAIRGPNREHFLCCATALSESDGPHPWIAQQDDAGRGFTLLILTPIAPRMGWARQHMPTA